MDRVRLYGYLSLICVNYRFINLSYLYKSFRTERLDIYTVGK